VRTRVGYAGGTTPDPTYNRIGDHSETIQLDYDPTLITYQELLDVFWQDHNPRVPPTSRQYASIIFYHDEGQRQLAQRSIATRITQQGEIWTELLPAGEFYWAEDYHQKYQLRGYRDLVAEFNAIYPDPRDWTNSTAVARVNGYLGRHGTLDQLQTEITDLGLSQAAQQRLLDVVAR
jgi:peptide-methionine (S)-S-oxide reductase